MYVLYTLYLQLKLIMMQSLKGSGVCQIEKLSVCGCAACAHILSSLSEFPSTFKGLFQHPRLDSESAGVWKYTHVLST